MPFALIVLSGDHNGPQWLGPAGAALAFLMVGAGFHTTQTAGLALASDRADDATRPRVVALLYVMLLIGMGGSSAIFGWLLSDFTQLRLIQVIQGSALVSLALNVIALWKQEPLQPSSPREVKSLRPRFGEAWRAFLAAGPSARFLVAVALGTAGFAMQDILLEPYGGEVLGLGVGQTTTLTALWALGSLLGFAFAAKMLARGSDPCRLAALGALIGIFAFAAVIFADPLGSAALFRVGTTLIGLGAALFAVGTLIKAMSMAESSDSGLVLGAWGAANATAAGLGVALGGVLRDVFGALAEAGALGSALSSPFVGYSVVYHIEIALLFATLIAVGPLVRYRQPEGASGNGQRGTRIGLAEMPT
jgi:BCD family chlorophyll transporter-like MFS transporter